MKNKTSTAIPINSIKHLDIRYNEDECLLQLPLFLVWRFEVRKIKIESNGLFGFQVHCYLITGEPNEKILLCLREDRNGSIFEIKTSRSSTTDAELSGYISKATASKLSENYDFKLKGK